MQACTYTTMHMTHVCILRHTYDSNRLVATVHDAMQGEPRYCNVMFVMHFSDMDVNYLQNAHTLLIVSDGFRYMMGLSIVCQHLCGCMFAFAHKVACLQINMFLLIQVLCAGSVSVCCLALSLSNRVVKETTSCRNTNLMLNW